MFVFIFIATEGVRGGQPNLAEPQPPRDGVRVVQDDLVLLVGQDVHANHRGEVCVHRRVDAVELVDESVFDGVGGHFADHDQARLVAQRLLPLGPRQGEGHGEGQGQRQGEARRSGFVHGHDEDHCQRQHDLEALGHVRTRHLEEVVGLVPAHAMQ